MKRIHSSRLVLGSVSVFFALAGPFFFLNSEAQTEALPEAAGLESNSVDAVQMEDFILPDVDFGGPVAEIARLVQAGVEQNLIMAYVTNSVRFFELDVDAIIYLHDLGTPPEIIDAAMARDRQLFKEGITSSTANPGTANEPVVAATVTNITVNYFVDTLAPYGIWVDIDGYGRCWRPSVVLYDTAWHPYGSNGHWVYTDAGWYWMSGYSWGWATFHYGRWFQHERYGWCWWPDTTWAPSWVLWRYDRDYCGWAPLPPHTVYRSGVGFVYRGSTVSIGFDFGLHYSAYTFVATRNFCDPNPWRHRMDFHESQRIHGRTSVIHGIDYDRHNRRVINAGIQPREISAVTRKEIRPVPIRYAEGKANRGERYERSGSGDRTLVVNRSPAVIAPRQNDGRRIPETGTQTRPRTTWAPSPQVTAPTPQARRPVDAPKPVQARTPDRESRPVVVPKPTPNPVQPRTPDRESRTYNTPEGPPSSSNRPVPSSGRSQTPTQPPRQNNVRPPRTVAPPANPSTPPTVQQPKQPNTTVRPIQPRVNNPNPTPNRRNESPPQTIQPRKPIIDPAPPTSKPSRGQGQGAENEN